MSELILTNARIVLVDDVVTGSVLVRDGLIADIDTTTARTGEDFDGDYLIPGLVELHTDHLENHYRPRPGVFWDPLAALHAHDVQVAGSGITTVFDAVRIGSDVDLTDMFEHSRKLVDAVRLGPEQGWLRAEHFLHLRCELPSHDVVEHFEAFADHPLTRLASVMDHTPGQRQFRDEEKLRTYYRGKGGQNDAELDIMFAQRLASQAQYAVGNMREIVALAHARNIPLASHDDTTVENVAEAVTDRVSVAEFPTTLEAASALHKAGIGILMGAPNVVRNGSHSGNIAAIDLAREGMLDILSSDYVPSSLLMGALQLSMKVPSIDLAAAVLTVTKRPAEAVGLADRGEIAIGKRADIIRVHVARDQPVVRSVWREGQRVA